MLCIHHEKNDIGKRHRSLLTNKARTSLLSLLCSVAILAGMATPANAAPTKPSVQWTMSNGVNAVSARIDEYEVHEGEIHYYCADKNCSHEDTLRLSEHNEDFDRWYSDLVAYLDDSGHEWCRYSSPAPTYISPDEQTQQLDFTFPQTAKVWLRVNFPKGVELSRYYYDTSLDGNVRVLVNGDTPSSDTKYTVELKGNSLLFTFTCDWYLQVGSKISIRYRTKLNQYASAVNRITAETSTNGKDWTSVGNGKTVQTGIVTVKKRDTNGKPVLGATLEIMHNERRNIDGNIANDGDPAALGDIYRWSKTADGTYYVDPDGTQKLTYDDDGTLRLTGLQGTYRIFEQYSPRQSTLRPMADITVTTDANGRTSVATDYTNIIDKFNGSSRIAVNGAEITISDIPTTRNPLDDLKQLEDEGLNAFYTYEYYNGGWPYPLTEAVNPEDANGKMHISKPGTYYVTKDVQLIKEGQTNYPPRYRPSLKGWHDFYNSDSNVHMDKFDQYAKILDASGKEVGVQGVLSDPNFYGKYIYRYLPFPDSAAASDYDHLTAFAGNKPIAGFDGKRYQYQVDSAWLNDEFMLVGLPPEVGYSITSSRNGNTKVIQVTNSKNASLNRTYTFTGATMPTPSEKVEVDDINLSDTNITLKVGEDKRIRWQVTPVNATYRNASWTTSASGVATVSADGVIHAVNAGKATITVTVGRKTKQIAVSVIRERITFRDVSSSTPHHEDIQWLADNGISTGWKMADGKYEFRGMSAVVRQDMAAFLRREARNRGILDAANWKPTDADWKRFRDVNRGTPHAEDILWLAHAEISTGWKEADGSSTFRGMDTVKRQDMAAFLKRLADKAGKSGGITPKTDFTDVTNATPHADDVRWLGGSGISTGYRNANSTWRFEGMTSVYRQDMAAFLHRLDNQLAK
ncbi:Ig-like domain-containing protein [Bifidobacterium choerinum]|uniref:Ig-like domain-containing protein n=1 Tax=Bifidobacterium choerinum TaxID=35760 RepID=UPI003F8F699F